MVPLGSSFFFNDTATTEIYTLSLHDALPDLRKPLCRGRCLSRSGGRRADRPAGGNAAEIGRGTRLNSSHANISYAVFCLKKKKTRQRHPPHRTHHPPITTSRPG